MTNEPHEREEYRRKCKHFLTMSGMCVKHSGHIGIGNGAIHISIACDGDCSRMKRYDKKNKSNK